MRKLSVLALGVIAAFAMATLASAATGANGDGRPPLPPGAVQVSENVYYLGKKKVDGVELEGYAHVLRAKAHASQSGANAAGRKPPKACYSLLGYPAGNEVATGGGSGFNTEDEDDFAPSAVFVNGSKPLFDAMGIPRGWGVSMWANDVHSAIAVYVICARP